MIPYYLKIPAKMLLSRLPISRKLLNHIGIFRHGSMIRPDYALEIMRRHLGVAGVDLHGLDVLEMGPGDSVGNGIIAFAMGANSSVLVDAGDWAEKSLAVYRPFIDWLVRELPVEPSARLKVAAAGWTTFDGMLQAFRIRYLVRGVEDLKALPSHSIDFWFSEAVLEHVRYGDVDATFQECRRLLRPGGRGSHVIDYKDHLQAGLNNMRFSSTVWESDFFSNSGFYTNRIRHGDLVARLRKAGFDVSLDQPNRWDRCPMARDALAPEFRDCPDSDLLIREAHVIVTPEPRLS